MIRTQIQLSEQQYARLRELAHRHHISVAELVRRGVDKLLDDGPAPDRGLRQRAMQLAGAFHAPEKDVAAKHDEYLATAYRK